MSKKRPNLVLVIVVPLILFLIACGADPTSVPPLPTNTILPEIINVVATTATPKPINTAKPTVIPNSPTIATNTNIKPTDVPAVTPNAASTKTNGKFGTCLEFDAILKNFTGVKTSSMGCLEGVPYYISLGRNSTSNILISLETGQHKPPIISDVFVLGANRGSFNEKIIQDLRGKRIQAIGKMTVNYNNVEVVIEKPDDIQIKDDPTVSFVSVPKPK